MPKPPAGGKKRAAPDEEPEADVRSTLGTDGQTLGEQLKDTEALMEVSKRQQEAERVRREVSLGTQPVTPGNRDGPEPQEEELVGFEELQPDQQFNGYVVAAVLGLVFAGAIYYGAGVTA